MPEWFKGDDLRSSGASRVGSNPASSIKTTSHNTS